MPPYRLHKCTAGCGKMITWQFAICANCEKIYGRSAANDWPDWLRESWNYEQRERRRNYRQDENEINFTDLESYIVGDEE